MTSQPFQNKKNCLIGVISDTHGRLNRDAVDLFEDVDFIIHAGDIGAPEILEALERRAPIFAVRGNMDGGSWTNDLPDTRVVKLGGALLYVIHDLGELDLDPRASGYDAVINGHTHRTAIREQNGVLYLNPGSASYPGDSQRPTVALLQVKGTDLSARFVEVGE